MGMKRTTLLGAAAIVIAFSALPGSAGSLERLKVQFAKRKEQAHTRLLEAYDKAIQVAVSEQDPTGADKLRSAKETFSRMGRVETLEIASLAKARSAYLRSHEKVWVPVSKTYDQLIMKALRSGDLDNVGLLKREKNAFYRSIYDIHPLARPHSYIEKVNSTPDLTQTDKEGGLPNGGKAYCGTVAVSNSLIWLAENGYPNLAPGGNSRKVLQCDLTRLLGTRDYMNTNPTEGTGTVGLTRGVGRYIRKQGYEFSRLEYQGWRKHPKEFGTGISEPKLPWIMKGLVGNSAVWLNIGWYTYDPSTDRYTRVGGHWVTLVGYTTTGRNREQPVLIIHDPASRAGREFANHRIRARRIPSGELTGDKKGLPRSAVGYYKLGGELCLNKKAQFGILDGAVVLEMSCPEPNGGKN